MRAFLCGSSATSGGRFVGTFAAAPRDAGGGGGAGGPFDFDPPAEGLTGGGGGGGPIGGVVSIVTEIRGGINE